MKVAWVLAVAGGLLVPRAASGAEEPLMWVVEAVGKARAAPDVAHVMMKMEYESGLAANAAAGGEKQLREFLDAVDALRIPNLRYRVTNNVMMPAAMENMGFVYTRNIVFDLRPDQEEVIAKLEDLGARYNSHCVTCIGSG